ncbi:MAG: phosphomethylpyrimidine synthase ThiC, partial [Dehalococcoidia bacterium]|nr:phosphomethylpyrimidine synthase ThiC [Dehalococcoidia bacterium]
WDREMSVARKKLDWEAQARLALDPERVSQVHRNRPSTSEACSMCGEYCAMALVEKYLGLSTAKC